MSKDRFQRKMQKRGGHHNGVLRECTKFEPRRRCRKERIVADLAAICAIGPPKSAHQGTRAAFIPKRAPSPELLSRATPLLGRHQRGFKPRTVIHEYWTEMGKVRHAGWHQNLHSEIQAMFRRLSGCARADVFESWNAAGQHNGGSIIDLHSHTVSWKPISLRPTKFPIYRTGLQSERVLLAIESGAETSTEVSARTGLDIKTASACMSQLARVGKIARRQHTVVYYSKKAQPSFSYTCK